MLLSAGILGTATGVWLFTELRALDRLDLMIGLSYVTLLTCRRYDDLRKPARGGARAPGHAGDTAPAGQPYVAAWLAVQAALQALENLRVGNTGVGDRVIIGFVGAIMGIGGGFCWCRC